MELLSTSPPSHPGSPVPVPSSPTTSSRLQWSALLGRRPRSGTTGTASHNLPSPSSDTDTGRTYFRRIGRSGSLTRSAQPAEDLAVPPTTTATAAAPSMPPAAESASYTIRLVPHLELQSRSLHFDPANRVLTSRAGLKIGRFNERTTTQSRDDSHKITFKSKVVSRAHAEISVDSHGRFWVKDTKSSSGTFLNHIRLSGPGLESRLYPLADGDILQLGVDYQGGTEEIYRCVKIKIELNRGIPKASNTFSAKARKQLMALGAAGPSGIAAGKANGKAAAVESSETTDCCICLFGVTVSQSLFIAPCSHVYHYKCIRPLLQMHHPSFSCPLCRTFADLEADVEQDDAELADEEEEEEEENNGNEALPEVPAKDADPPAQDETINVSAALRSPSSGNLRARSIASRRSSAASRRFASGSHDVPIPDAGDFQADMRRSSIHVSGPHGAGPLAITGRASRPSSVRNFDMHPVSSPSPKSTPQQRELVLSPPDTAVGPSNGVTGQEPVGSSSMPQTEEELGSSGSSGPSSESLIPLAMASAEGDRKRKAADQS